MKLSLKLINELSLIKYSLKTQPDLLTKIAAQLGAIEQTIDYESAYELATIVKVVEVQPIKISDHLKLCLIDDQQAIQDSRLTRNQAGYIEVVCGASNVIAGMLAVWLPPGAVIPESYFSNQPIYLSVKKLANQTSHGMLASARELGINDEHDGIVDLSLDQSVQPLKIGSSFKTSFGLNDLIIDIENKMFTHRPDLFSLVGLARELAGIYDSPYQAPSWYQEDVKIIPSEPKIKLTVNNQLADNLCRRFSAVSLSNISVGPSPLNLQIDLMRLGLRSINNIVDITNLVMYLTGQPLHAYDANELNPDLANSGVSLGVRLAYQAESLKLLNQSQKQLSTSDIVIVNNSNNLDEVIGLAGVMGGLSSEVSSKTTNIVLESANFDMYAIRRTAMQHGIFSDAVTRFTKGQSPRQTLLALNLAIQLIKKYCPASIVSSNLCDNYTQDLSTNQPIIELDNKTLSSYLGLELEPEVVCRLLNNVNLVTSYQAPNFSLKPGFWRMDLENKYDVIEEISRLYDVNKLPLGLPRRQMPQTKTNPVIDLKTKIRRRLSFLGGNELANFSYLSKKEILFTDQNTDDAYAIASPLSPDLQYFRTNLLSSILPSIHYNHQQGHDKFMLYELGICHRLSYGLDVEQLPKEISKLAVVLSANDKAHPELIASDAFYALKAKLVDLLASLGLEVNDLEFLANSQNSDPLINLFNKTAVAELVYRQQNLGLIGLFNERIIQLNKLPNFVAGLEIDVNTLVQLADNKPFNLDSSFHNSYPVVRQDVTLLKSKGLNYSDFLAKLQAQIAKLELPDDLVYRYSLIDSYYDQTTDSQKLTYRFSFRSSLRSYTDQEISKLLDNLIS